MARRPVNVLIVEPEPTLVEILVSALTKRFNARITCVSDAEGCLDVELSNPHDLAIVDLNDPEFEGFKLAEELLSLSNRPVMILADDPAGADVIGAMRAGVSDVFRKPFPVVELLDAVENVLRNRALGLQQAAKYAKMREMVRRVVRERRDLNRRMELVCRDLVGAHRRLVHRVIALEDRTLNNSAEA